MNTSSPSADDSRRARGEALANNAAADALTDDELAILEFEKIRWKYAGAKETAVREQFGMTLTRYYQLLNAIIERPAARAAEPLLVSRLQRLRDIRRHARNRPVDEDGAS